MREGGVYVLALPVNEQVKLQNCARNEGEGYVLALPVNEQVKIQNCARNDELNKEVGYVASEAEFVGSPSKENSRKASNVHTDDICVGDSDPIVIQNENLNGLSSETFSRNNPDDLCVSGNNNQVNSGEITSESSTHSYTESGFCTSYVTRDSPEDANTTESRKLRLRIRKRSEECSSNKSNPSAQILSNELHDGICTDDERRAVKRRALPSKGVGKTLPPQSTLLVTGMKKKGGNGDGKKRNDGLHKLLFLPNGLPDGTYLAYNVKGQTILEGCKKENGIFCNHCSNVISPSQFEAHAGMAARKKPYQHIYTADGHTLHDIAVTLAEGQNHQTAPMNNDDIRPTSSDSVDSSSRPRPIIVRMSRRADKKSETDCGGSCVLCSANDFSVNKFDDRTVIICDQCEKEFHVGCLREDGRCDLKGLPKDKWFCCCDCEKIFTSLRNLVARGSVVIPSSESSKINKKLMEEGLRQVDDNDVQVRLLNGKRCHPEHRPLLSKAVCLFREGFGSITAPGGSDLIPPMVHGKNISGQEFGGMYCVVLTVKSVVVSVGLLRILGCEVAEVPLVATRWKYRGKGYFLALFSHIEKLIGLLKVETLVLPATEAAKPMWINKFGFREISQEKLSTYTRVFQLTNFSDTVMLEKQVEQ